jgi:predicted membrane-bound spermidine synthase
MNKRTQEKAIQTCVSPALRRYLYCTAAVTGGAIMIVEILGAKMLAPYVGTSHFVWTAQIATTLCALTVGYYAGGRMVDRIQDLGRLYGCIMVAAIYLCASSLCVKPVTYAFLPLNLALGTLLSSAVLFFAPLALLAMTGPFLTRMIATTLAGVGGTVGRITSVGTMGSVVGTVLIGYVLVPLMPNSYILFLTAGLLMATAAGYFFVWNKKIKKIPLVMTGLAIASALVFAGLKNERTIGDGTMTEIYRHNSSFGLLQVFGDPDGTRLYLNDFLMQNSYDVNRHKSLSPFTYMLHDLAASYAENIRSVLCIGMGVGIVPMQFVNEGAKVDVVEINPAVVPVAEHYFRCEPRRFNLVIGDGRCFVNRTHNRYDAIVLDAFVGDAVPSHVMSAEAFSAMKRLLTAQGVLVINCFGNLEKGKDFSVSSIDKTLKSVFPGVRLFAETRGGNNYYFVASNNRDLAVINRPDTAAIPPVLRKKVAAAFNSSIQPSSEQGIVLTDDYNPIEFYDAANREFLRKRMAEFAQHL